MVHKVIDKYIIPQAKTIVAYKTHFNDNDSFKMGIRRTNRTNTTVDNYAAALRENLKEGPNDTTDKYNKYDYTKSNKRKTIQIEYDTEFPEIEQANKKILRNRQRSSRPAQRVSNTRITTRTNQATGARQRLR